MPQIICGRANSSREEIFFDKVKKASEQGNVLVIVPDQYSFEMEKLLYNRLGAKRFNSISSVGITSLCERIRREYGGSGKNSADDNTRIIAMFRAQAKLRADRSNELTECGRSLLKPAFISETVSLISQLIKAGASPQTLQTASEISTAASPRLHDISVIYQSYLDELDIMGLADTMSEVTAAADMARKNGYFKGRTVFFDNFTGFSADQLLLVEAAVAQADRTVFSLVFDEERRGSNVFALTARTISKIKSLGTDHGRDTEVLHADGQLMQTPSLAHINRDYFSYKHAKTDSQGMVKVGKASDVYEESDYICSEIVRLTKECGYRYREIAVICGSVGTTADVFAASAQRYEIPYFIDRTDTALNTLPSRYLLSILDAAVSKNYRTEKLLRIIKSPLSPFFDYDANDIEEFCLTWNVEGDMWLSPFVPGGSADVKPRIEQTRQKLIEPIEKFRKRSENAPAGEICQALFELLDELKMSDQIYSQVRSLRLENETELEFMRSFKQVWLGMVGAVKTIYDQMKDTPISLRSFYELLRSMLDGLILSSPPQKADCVVIGDAGRTRLSGIKTLFIMQANDGVFPHKITGSGLLRDGDIKALSAQGAELELSPAVKLDNERMELYSAVTAPSERLYVTYSLADISGSAASPSQLPLELCEMFEDDISVNISDLPQSFFCTSYRTAFNSILEHYKDNSPEAANIRASLADSPEYAGRLAVIKAYAGQKNESLSPDTARRLFFPGDTSLNATCINDYYKCPFGYFCKYGLGLRTLSKVDIDSRYLGNIVHYCLEMVMSKESGGKRIYDSGFSMMSDKQLRDNVSRFADEYVEREMGGDYGKSLSFRDALSRLKDSVTHMAMNFRDEMKRSGFLPAAFEYRLKGSGGGALLSIDLDGTKIDLHGIVDRADIYSTEHGTWLRIVDYKTGRQQFDEAKIYNGLDLQMLIYLLALTTGKSGLTDGELLPGGIMYSHMRFVEPDLSCAQVYDLEEKGELEQEIKLIRAKTYKPDGIMQGGEVIDGHNTELQGVYTVFSFKKDGKLSSAGEQHVIGQSELAAMELFAMGKVKEMAGELVRGRISPEPVAAGKSLPCVYCDYRALCKNASPKEYRSVGKNDKQLLREELKRISEEEGIS